MIEAAQLSMIAIERSPFQPNAGERASKPNGATAHRLDRLDVSLPIGGGDPREIRHDLVRRIRSEIAENRYLSDDKIDAVVEKLHRKLFRE